MEAKVDGLMYPSLSIAAIFCFRNGIMSVPQMMFFQHTTCIHI